jgi:hypothetical protein
MPPAKHGGQGRNRARDEEISVGDNGTRLIASV